MHRLLFIYNMPLQRSLSEWVIFVYKTKRGTHNKRQGAWYSREIKEEIERQKEEEEEEE